MEIALVVATILTAFGTLALAYATFRLANRTGEMAEASRETVEENREMVEEMREARIAQERPHVIVDTDHSEPSMVDVVLRNIGKGAAKDITFEFSATMEAPESIDNPLWVPVNEQPYFSRGIDYLAPGAELRCFWGSMRTLPKLLRERGLHDGITITSKYKSLMDEQYETEWTVNPLLMADRTYR